MIESIGQADSIPTQFDLLTRVSGALTKFNIELGLFRAVIVEKTSSVLHTLKIQH